MLEANAAAVGNVKQIQVIKKEPKCHKLHKDLTNRTDLKTIRNQMLRTLSAAVVTSQSKYFTEKQITKNRMKLSLY